LLLPDLLTDRAVPIFRNNCAYYVLHWAGFGHFSQGLTINKITNPTFVKVHVSDSFATLLKLHAFYVELGPELQNRVPLAEIGLANEIDVGAPVVAEVNGQPSSLLETFVH
jgi:hypothetical protein